jgi:hypothetical protein
MNKRKECRKSSLSILIIVSNAPQSPPHDQGQNPRSRPSQLPFPSLPLHAVRSVVRGGDLLGGRPAVQLGGGRHGLAWRLPASCARGNLLQVEAALANTTTRAVAAMGFLLVCVRGACVCPLPRGWRVGLPVGTGGGASVRLARSGGGDRGVPSSGEAETWLSTKSRSWSGTSS